MQPIIRDSEDEDEEEFIVAEEHDVPKPTQQSSVSWMVAEADEILAQNPSQGLARTDDQSSLSTGDLQRQIADASRGLFDSTSDQATTKQPSMASSSNPAAGKTRRHSAVVRSGGTAKSLKRTKTGSVTYGSSKNIRLEDHRQFDALREEALPGTLQTDFANHEPTVMFRDTGSTVADNESSQLRMVEQTINQGKQLSNASEVKLAESDKPDSSFPWPASSVTTHTPGGNASAQASHGVPALQEDAATRIEPSDEVSAPLNIAVSQSEAVDGADMTIQQDVAQITQPCANDANVPASISKANLFSSCPDEINTTAREQSVSPGDREVLKSSPQVSVPRVRVKSTTETTARPDEGPRSRKRKASAGNEEFMNSEDRAIGLPKELYQPRLSRRRASGPVEQPEDFSKVPEKAAKRRRKTVKSASAAPELAEDGLAYEQSAAPLVKAVPEITQSAESATGTSGPVSTIAESATSEKPQPSREEVRAALKRLDFPLTTTSFDGGMSEVPSPNKEASPLSPKRVPAAGVASMPPPSPAIVTSASKRRADAAATFAMPPPTSSATRSSRRSHTTIFEDHVEFGGSQQRSPSLRQQQATRKSAALKEVKGQPSQATRRKRRSIVQDEEDDQDEEDELVKDHVAEVPVPKKRGRPAKSAADKNSVAAERVLQDSDAEADDEVIVGPPKKKGRVAKVPAAKPKSAERVLDDSEAEFSEHEAEAEEPVKKKVGRQPPKAKAGGKAKDDAIVVASENRTTANSPDAFEKRDSPQAPPPTPPPDRQTASQTKQSQTKQDAATKVAAPTKPAPTTHSPIKTSSKVLHRVGLNRRQRVQPLLKMVRPPAPAKQR